MTLSMWDTIAPRDLVGHIPASGGAVAGYVVGANSWPDYWELVQLFPNAQHLSIGGRNERARCLDVESGFAHLSDVPWWLDNMAEANPVLYGSASILSALRAAAGQRRVLIWAAHYTYHPHICGPDTCGYPQADATQWTDHAIPGRDADQSLVADHFFTESPQRQDDPHNFGHFASAKFKGGLQGGPWEIGPWGELDEREVVLHYYGAHAHPHRYPRDGGYMTLLRAELTALANRVAEVATKIHPHADGRPSWGTDYRGERFQRMIHMGQGAPPQ